jgi:hypothetical protein
MRTALKSITFAALLLGLIGCAIDNPVDAPLPPQQSAIQAYQPFGLPAGNGLQKSIVVKGMVTVANGGQLSFVHSQGNFSVRIVLTFEPGSVANDMELNMLTDDQVLAATFGPEGTQFLQPGTLSVEASGLKLPKNMDAQALLNSLKMLYLNKATGNWEPIEAGGYSVDVATGTVVCTNGVIRHFSRYGFGM